MRYGLVILLCLAILGVGLAWQISAYQDCRRVGMSITSCALMVTR